MESSRPLWISAVSIALLLMALPISWQVWPARTPAAITIDQTAIQRLGQLQDQHGNSAAASLGERGWALIFFGFTHCADICPATLSRMVQIFDELGGGAEQLQPIFVTLDPQRDTSEHLASYLAFFDERLLGLRGTAQQTQQVADAWGIYARRVPTSDSYMLDHSTTVFLLAPDGQVRQRFSGREDARHLAREIAAELVGEG